MAKRAALPRAFLPRPSQFFGRQYTFGAGDVRRGQTRNPPGFQYTAGGNACNDKYGRLEKGCKAQLTFRDGQPLLRFCKTKGKPGLLVPVQSAEEAVRVGRDGCACLAGKSLAQAQTCFPNSAGLGRVRRTR